MKYFRRGIWYLAGRLFLVCLIAALGITVFYYAMNLSNIQIILKDGMACRAKIIMGMEEDPNELNKYFQSAWISTDEQISAAKYGASSYADYKIRGIDHRLDMGYMWTWPWDDTVRLNITERIPRIDGRVKGIRADEVIAAQGADAVYPPAWPEVKYRVTLNKKEYGLWKIESLIPLE